MTFLRYEELNTVLEFLEVVHKQAKTNHRGEPTARGLANIAICDYCKKKGHDEQNCWTKAKKKEQKMRASEIECWKCGKKGHKKSQCRSNKGSNLGITAVANEVENSAHLPTYVDSACSEHLVKDLSLLKNAKNIENELRSMKTAGGLIMRLTHKGMRTIEAENDGPLILREAYYAEDAEYNLVSVPRLAEKGVEIKFTHQKAHIEKGETRINLEKRDGLWSIPERRVGTAASLIMEREGTTDSINWHCRLGHPSKEQIARMVAQGIAPKQACELAQNGCSVCMTTYPSRRPIPNVAERSGERTVQVDFMPVGHKEKGWKGEVGAYTFADRTSKIIKIYPVKTATAKDALTAPNNYLTTIVPYLKGGITCIQTDAGSQFDTKVWAQRCATEGIKCRMCPVAHQAMNGQVERS